MRSKCHAKPQCWANIFGSKSNSFLRVSTLNADLRGSPFANHLLQTFWDSDKLYLIDVAFVGKSKTRREPRGQPCTNNTYNIWRESTVKKSSRLHEHGTFRPTCELERGPTGASSWASEALAEWSRQSNTSWGASVTQSRNAELTSLAQNPTAS